MDFLSCHFCNNATDVFTPVDSVSHNVHVETAVESIDLNKTKEYEDLVAKPALFEVYRLHRKNEIEILEDDLLE